MLSFGAEDSLAARVQTICTAVSYTGEVKNPSRVLKLVAENPELAVVQDADRLDAIGAVGIGRAFTYGGAMTTRGMEGSVMNFHEKLLGLESMMKTAPGKKLARERTEILCKFQECWNGETAVQNVADEVLRKVIGGDRA